MCAWTVAILSGTGPPVKVNLAAKADRASQHI